jgi:hypothetical protein
MIRGGVKLLVGSGGRVVGPGHFGLLDLGQGVQKFSMHWEADLDKGGASVLDIRPLQWKDGWPVAGENLKEGTYEIESIRTGTSLELAVEEFRSVAVVGAAAEAPVLVDREAAVPEQARLEPLEHPTRELATAPRGDRADPAVDAECLPGRARQFRRKMSRRSRRVGRTATSIRAWRRISARRNRNGPSRLSRTPVATLARLISRSPSPARTARSQPRTTPSWLYYRSSPEGPNNYGG